jgi:hypothetical protein
VSRTQALNRGHEQRWTHGSHCAATTSGFGMGSPSSERGGQCRNIDQQPRRLLEGRRGDVHGSWAKRTMAPLASPSSEPLWITRPHACHSQQCAARGGVGVPRPLRMSGRLGWPAADLGGVNSSGDLIDSRRRVVELLAPGVAEADVVGRPAGADSSLSLDKSPMRSRSSCCPDGGQLRARQCSGDVGHAVPVGGSSRARSGQGIGTPKRSRGCRAASASPDRRSATSGTTAPGWPAKNRKRAIGRRVGTLAPNARHRPVSTLEASGSTPTSRRS